MSTLGSVIIRDIFANRPAAGVAGRLFYSSDTLVNYRDNGVSWDNIGSGSTSSGTVTSVGFTGGLISVATATTTPALTVAGTSGGIPYFSASSTWASSAALTANGVVIGGGAGATPTATSAGTAGQVLVSNGSGSPPTFQTGMVLIQEQELSGAVATVTFSSIPATFRNLQLIICGRCSAASNYQDIYAQFNGDTGANYSRETVLGQVTTASAAQNTSSATAPIGGMAGATSDANAPGVITILIPNYIGTTFDKAATSMSGAMNGALSSWLVESTAFHWNSTAAINAILLGVVGGSNFNIGSVFSLYGF